MADDRVVDLGDKRNDSITVLADAIDQQCLIALCECLLNDGTYGCGIIFIFFAHDHMGTIGRISRDTIVGRAGSAKT